MVGNSSNLTKLGVSVKYFAIAKREGIRYPLFERVHKVSANCDAEKI